jgi:hypothetical protein
MHLDVTSLSHIHYRFDFDFDLIFFPFLEIMASHMATSYMLQIAQMNEEPPLKSFLNLTLTKHLRDENPEPQEVCVHLEVEPPRA